MSGLEYLLKSPEKRTLYKAKACRFGRTSNNMAEQPFGPILKNVRGKGPLEIVLHTMKWQVERNTERKEKISQQLDRVGQETENSDSTYHLCQKARSILDNRIRLALRYDVIGKTLGARRINVVSPAGQEERILILDDDGNHIAYWNCFNSYLT